MSKLFRIFEAETIKMDMEKREPKNITMEIKSIYEEKSDEEVFAMLEEAGLRPVMCDTPAPFFENAVPCGKPEFAGDPVMDYTMLPQDIAGLQGVFFCRARGTSMTGVDIHEGDWLRVMTDCQPQDGDHILVYINGDPVVKTFCHDEEGIPWLVPQNSDFVPFRLTDEQNVRFVGVISQVLRQLPRGSYRNCMQQIKQVKAAEMQKQEIEQYQVARAIREIAPMVEIARQWYAVFRTMVDLFVIEEDDYDGFCRLVNEEVPDHGHKPSCTELQRMAIQSFAKSVVLWKESNAPVKGKRFKDYLKIAQRMKELLWEK